MRKIILRYLCVDEKSKVQSWNVQDQKCNFFFVLNRTAFIFKGLNFKSHCWDYISNSDLDKSQTNDHAAVFTMAKLLCL